MNIMNIKLLGLLAFISFSIVLLVSICKQENFTDEENKELVPQLKRPYVHLYDNKGKQLNVVLISKPFGTDEEFKHYEDNKDKLIFLGISSYLKLKLF